MHDNVIEYTPENEFQIAHKRTRIIAFLVDLCIFCFIGILLGFFFGEPIEGIGFELTGIPALAMMLIGFFLWPISEGIWGQTLGKRMLNIKVVTDHYELIDITASITRYILGFIDYIFLLGMIVASSNKMNKRIGDMAANTIVIQI
ncbi:RDD family protein [uncultured Dokdonia sp.]|uniref:RDD family protein n=1 Tax=uncultured Dokdonia sp. TaxID=575653 RepID=UPI002631C3A6|nr:RDD family protein [uncultured Dokdonia sp.]